MSTVTRRGLLAGGLATTALPTLARAAAAADAPPPGWSREFDAWAQEAMEHEDVDALLDFLAKAPAARVAHPRTEHFAPLFVSLGAAYGPDGSGGFDSRSVIDGFWFGLSKRSWQFS